MKIGVYAGNMGELADVRVLADLAAEMEAVGYDGFFLSDVVSYAGFWDDHYAGHPHRLVDPQVAVTAIGLATQRINFGLLVSPLPRRHPVKFAREAMTLDQLSNGRFVVAVGSGYAAREFKDLGLNSDAKARADRLDESMAVVDSLLRGQPTSFKGKYISVPEAHFTERPGRVPRAPIWCAALVGKKRSLRRAAQWDGMVLLRSDDRPLSIDEVKESIAYAREHRAVDGPFDLVVCPMDPTIEPTDAEFRELTEAGVTWWVHLVKTHDDVRALLETTSALRRA
ncbi:LLM class flavin-dependent oxidoreductase [Nocardia pseudovaccinii]|uniref:LLM class flavin-dependent oxidoreductase n=1 Tax=Nocardia pseudovaccinii TaxID=189540 RepID=UPI003D917E84